MKSPAGDEMSGMKTMSPPHVEGDAFKAVMAQWATGVTIATTCQDGAPVGMTATSFSTLSLHPPQILICANRKANTHTAIVESGFFAVNLLTAEQQEWGMRFASPEANSGERFCGVPYAVALTGAPILTGVLGWLDCNLQDSHSSGDHTIFIGAVVACEVTSAADPLLYFRRAWQRLAQISHKGE